MFQSASRASATSRLAGAGGEVAAAGGLGGVLGALDVGGADRVRLPGLGVQLGGDLQGGSDCQRGERVQDEASHGCVDAGAADVLAGRGAGGDALALAGVVGDERAVAAGVVADGHPLAAFPADHQALEQGGAFPGRSGLAVTAVGGGVGGQLPLVGLVLFPADVAVMRPGEQGGPLLARLGDRGGFPAGTAVSAAAIEVGARVAGVVQHEQDLVVAQRLPVQLPGPLADGITRGELQAAGVECLDHGGGRPGGGEGGKQVADRLADCGVGVRDHVTGAVIGEPDRKADRQLAAGGLSQQPTAHAGLQVVQPGLRDLALHPQQHPVIDRRWVIQAVFVADQGAVEGAHLDQSLPVGVVTGQPGAFQAQHDAGPAEGDLTDQLLEPGPVGRGCSRGALVDVDDVDLPGVPAERDGASFQVVLAAGGLGVVDHLVHR